MLGERRPETLEVACAKRDGTASRSAAGRVGEANELGSLCISQELHDRREALFASTLRHGQLLYHLGLAPRGCGLGHATDGSERNRAEACRNVPNSTLGGHTFGFLCGDWGTGFQMKEHRSQLHRSPRLTRLLASLMGAVALVAVGPAAATEGGANQVVLATATADGSSTERSGLQFALVGGLTVGSENLAQATSVACSGCTTIAVSVQAVVATGEPSVVVPHNAAVAVNSGCTSCRAYAYAYQYVLTKAGPIHLSPRGQADIAAMRAEIAATAASGLSFDALTARLDELTAEFRALIDRELVAAGAPVNGSPTRSIDALSAS
jgi:hypothetical protein